MLSLVQTLRELVATASVNPMGRTGPEGSPAESALTDYLERLFRRLQIPAQRQLAEPGRENLLARVEADPESGRADTVLLFEAHQDTVPVTGMTVPPFTPEIREGRLYGRGACDVKGGMTAMLVALARLHQERPKRMPTVIMACSVNEECGFTGAKAIAAAWREDTATRRRGDTEIEEGERGRGGERETSSDGAGKESPTASPHLRVSASPRLPLSPSPRLPLSASPPLPLSRSPTLIPRRPDFAVVSEPTDLEVVVAHKGLVRWRCHALGRAAHSSTPEAGDNAIYKMARAVTAIEKYARDVVGTLATHPLCGPATLSVGTITGGVSVNTVPDRCTIEIDRRLAPGEKPDAARQHLIDYLREKASLGFTLEHDPPFMEGPPLADQHNRPLADRLAKAAAGLAAPCRAVGVPYGTDGALFAATGVPTVIFGPGSIAQAHTADEWIALDQVEKAAEIYYRFVKSFC